MSISQKCQYALRAVFELCKRQGEGPQTIGRIARVQAIPARFLELILGELRQGGFVESRRGKHGGYLLARAPETLTAGQIIRFIDGPVAPVKCIVDGTSDNCPLRSSCAFMGMWRKAQGAVSAIYDNTTYRELLETDARRQKVSDYCI
jgi:Rrf2 family cysteine metabolism transcriptional repressor